MAKFILPALALAGTALAQCDGPSFTISASEDASQLASCQTYDGDIIIASEVSGQVQLNGVSSITGDLRCTNASQLTALSADRLSSIGGTFDLEELQILSSLRLPSISRVNRVRWIALPGLQSLNFGAGINAANNVYISNTGLTDLRGIELTAVGAMDINNNQYLRTINVNSLTNVTQALSFSANGMNLAIEFPNLEAAGNLTFRNVSSISMPSLANVPGSIGFYSNPFESFAAPNLTATGNTIAFVDSPMLSNLSFPSLELIGGGLLLANNSELTQIAGSFPALSTINGDINFYGTFENVAFPSLTDVKGAATVYTSSTNGTICDLFNRAKTGQAIKGQVTCETGSTNTANNGTGTRSGSGSSRSSGAAVANLNFDPSAPLTGFAAFVAALLFI
ncbi:cell wall protein Ecm33 [Lithohypha guttulata]|uniref:Cell wall protein Ecm33 n=1 Tax=Lithohypha guttulata TaxID=1690604 RepID=A0AAN7T794_9EURO|nr:cell wall protein Ecm33 [Lithohypha guttulata]KAK5091734.1 cell wall protein Ecm33 [Lithohypha guttulata]